MQSAQYRVIGSREVFEREQERLGTHVDLSAVDDSVEMAGTWQMGRVQRKSGAAALESLEAGVEMLESGAISALVTAPVSKEALRMAGFVWPGQTEFLAERLGAKRYAMLAWTPRFKVVFVTIHMPLAQVARHITAQVVFEKAVLLDEFLRRSGLGHNPAAVRVSPAAGETLTSQSGTVPDSPRIGVMALNPHGEEFSLGEERRIAAGAALARKAGINALGPIPADAAVAGAGIHHKDTKTQRGLDAQAGRPPFDGFVAMYHDQGMIPAKLLGRDAGVNVTLGLGGAGIHHKDTKTQRGPGRIRTSPLHGVAFDIAGKGIASASSMIAAIRLARKLASAC